MHKYEVIELIKEFQAESKKVTYEPVYYKRKGKLIRRSYDNIVHTARYHELRKVLSSEETRVFKCEDCGKIYGYFELESWICDFENDNYTCCYCYEDSMGEDL